MFEARSAFATGAPVVAREEETALCLFSPRYPHRVDVTPSGSVLWMDGRDRYSWVSLTGIRFAPGELGQTKLAAENGWSLGEVRIE